MSPNADPVPAAELVDLDRVILALADALDFIGIDERFHSLIGNAVNFRIKFHLFAN